MLRIDQRELSTCLQPEATSVYINAESQEDKRRKGLKSPDI